MQRSQIVGTGSYAPARILTNQELAARIDTSDEWITTRTGIKERHLAAEGEQTSDMAVAAAKNALEMAGLVAKDLDLVIVGTISGDMPMPATAAFVAHKLGIRCPAFDVSAACAGSVYGLSIADQFVKTGHKKRVLVVGVELLSRLLDWQDRNTCVLFGDAAGAMIVAPSSTDRGILSTHIWADGSQTGILNIPGGGSLHPASHEMIDQRLDKVKMQGREVYKFAIRALTEVVLEALNANGLGIADVDHLVPHQANIRIVEQVMQKLGLSAEKAILNIDRYGNTSSASVPVTLDEGVRSGRIKSGDLVAMMAIGAGMTWGSALVRW
ncbi:MAG: ketoacyl-ACP synthase III [Deltaproteobacteria bacterium]|nr:ketoacyl-ACP synthase III [Deltaproteobacteria bacterium]